MEKFVSLTAAAAAFTRQNVDTDAIIPKQFLKTIKRHGLASGLFYDLRHDDDGKPIGGFVLDDPKYKAARILVVGENFGCGSSREHAPWSLLDAGFRCLIAPSFADIFYNNCFKNGILPIVLKRQQVDELAAFAEAARHEFQIDLPSQKVVVGNEVFAFEIDSFKKDCLLNGWDELALTLKQEPQLTAFEERHRQKFSWLG